jgi:hypothetical protein
MMKTYNLILFFLLILLIQAAPLNAQTNLVINGGFETVGENGRPVGWEYSSSSNVTWSVSTDIVQEGTNALKADIGTGGTERGILQDIPVVQGETYTVSFFYHVYREPTRYGIFFSYEWKDANGDILWGNGYISDPLPYVLDLWMPLETEIVAPEGAATMQIYISGTFNIGVYFDDVRVVKSAPLTLNPTVWNDAPAAGGNLDVAVTTTDGGSWTALSEAGWLSVSPAAGAGETLTLTAAANPAAAIRSGKVKVSTADGSYTDSITVTQLSAAADLTLSNDLLAVGAAENVYGITIISSVNWTAATEAEWIALSQESGAPGSVELTVTVAANQTPGEPRSAVVTVQGEGVEAKTITVTQTAIAPTLTLGGTGIMERGGSYTKNIAAAGESSDSDNFLVIGSNTSWEITGIENWMTLAQTSGTGLATHIGFTAEANSGGTRTAVITIATTSTEKATITLTVTQSGTTGIADVKAGLPVRVSDGKLIVIAPAGVPVEVYNTLGVKLQSQIAGGGETVFEGLPSGRVLIVRSGKSAAKVIL